MTDKSTNLTKIEREKMLSTLDGLKLQHPEELEAINQIMSFIKSRKYGLNFEKHIEQVDIDLQNHLPVFKPFKQIDPQAENKFYALKDWAASTNESADKTVIHVAFVRYSAFQKELYISNTEYTEDMRIGEYDTPWKSIDDFFNRENK